MMKTIHLHVIALMTALALPALADKAKTEPRTVLANGCILIDHGGYFSYERGCPSVDGKTGTGSAYIDTDGDGRTDRFTPDKNR